MKIVRHIGGNQNRFDELMKLFLGNEYRITQRAAWAVSYCAEAYPELIKKHLRNIILNLRKPIHVAVKRNYVRLLQHIEIPENLQGVLTEICFGFLADREPVAVKVFSMTVLAKICIAYP